MRNDRPSLFEKFCYAIFALTNYCHFIRKIADQIINPIKFLPGAQP